MLKYVEEIFCCSPVYYIDAGSQELDLTQIANRINLKYFNALFHAWLKENGIPLSLWVGI